MQNMLHFAKIWLDVCFVIWVTEKNRKKISHKDAKQWQQQWQQAAAGSSRGQLSQRMTLAEGVGVTTESWGPYTDQVLTD